MCPSWALLTELVQDFRFLIADFRFFSGPLHIQTPLPSLLTADCCRPFVDAVGRNVRKSRQTTFQTQPIRGARAALRKMADSVPLCPGGRTDISRDDSFPESMLPARLRKSIMAIPSANIPTGHGSRSSSRALRLRGQSELPKVSHELEPVEIGQPAVLFAKVLALRRQIASGQ